MITAYKNVTQSSRLWTLARPSTADFEKVRLGTHPPRIFSEFGYGTKLVDYRTIVQEVILPSHTYAYKASAFVYHFHSVAGIRRSLAWEICTPMCYTCIARNVNVYARCKGYLAYNNLERLS